MSEEKKPHTFKPGDRVWFEGKKHTLHNSGDMSDRFPLEIESIEDDHASICFDKFGKQLSSSPKPSLKPVKKKKRQEVWVAMGPNGQPHPQYYPSKADASEVLAMRGGWKVVRFVKAKEQG